MAQLTRRQFLSRSPLAILAFVLMPGWMLRLFAPPSNALREINFAIHEEIGVLIYKPDVMAHYPKRVTVPVFEIAAYPMISIAEIKARRFDVVQRAVLLEKAAGC